MQNAPKKAQVIYTRLTPENHRALKLRAIEEGSSIAGIVDRLVAEYLKKKGTPAGNGGSRGASVGPAQSIPA